MDGTGKISQTPSSVNIPDVFNEAAATALA
jgi:hypothetical protein